MIKSMLDSDVLNQHLGGAVRLSDHVYDLEEVESYVVDAVLSEGIEVSNDCTAHENPYFKTINYTTYAGMLIMHPLNFELSFRQMWDALADGLQPLDYTKPIIERFNSGSISKYKDMHPSSLSGDVAVLAGSNKLEQHIDLTKVASIDAIVKPHPLTSVEDLELVEDYCGRSRVADPRCDLYSLIEGSETVYTSHISETAFTSLCLGKKIEPIDKLETRLTGAFSHINYFCFSYDNPIEVLCKIFTSAKSGVICPQVDVNWKAKVDAYIGYITNVRNIEKNRYTPRQ